MFSDMTDFWKTFLGTAGQNAVNSALGFVDGAINRNFQRKEAEKNRNWQSEEAALQRNWSAAEAERARDWNEEMYEKYNSLSGKISQAEQAGVNPMFAVTGSAVSPVSANASAPGGASVGSVSNPTGMSASVRGLFDIMSNITELKRQQSEANVNEAQASMFNAQEENIRKNTSWVDRINEVNIAEVQSNIERNSALVSESLQNVKESISRVSVNDAVIRVHNADVALKGSQTELNVTKQIVESLNVEQMKLILPYVQARQEAEIWLTNASAKHEEASASKDYMEAEKAMYDANYSLLNVLKEQKLIDSSYYDDYIKLMHYDAKNEKRDYKWKPVNDVMSNLSYLLIGIGSVGTGAGQLLGAMNGMPMPSNPIGFGK